MTTIVDRTFEWVRNHTGIFISILLLLNLWIKCNNIAYGSFDLDEAWHTYYSQYTFGDLLRQAAEDPNPPLYNILIGIWIKIFGVGETGVRLFSVLCSTITAPLLFLFVRKYFNTESAVVGSLIFTVSNIQLLYSHDARVYALLGLLTVLSFFSLFNFLTNAGRTNFMLYVFFTASMLFTHTIAILLLPVHCFAAILYPGVKSKTTWRMLAGQFFSCIGFGLWIMLSPYYRKEKATTWLHAPTGNEIRNLFVDYLGSKQLFEVYVVLGLLSLLILPLYYWHKKSSDQIRKALILASWALFPIAADILISYTFLPIFLTRYMLYSSIGLYVLIAYLVSVFPVAGIFRVLFAVFIIFNSYTSLNFNTFSGEDWRAGVNFVKEKQDKTTLVLTSPYYEYYPFAFYYNIRFFKEYKHTLALMESSHVYVAEDPDIFKKVDPDEYKKIVVLTAQEKMVDPSSLLHYLKQKCLMTDSMQWIGVRGYVFDNRKNWKDVNRRKIDFDQSKELNNVETIVEVPNAHSGKLVSKTNRVHPYSSGYFQKVGKLIPDANVADISAWIYCTKPESKGVLVLSIEDTQGKPYFYKTKEVKGTLSHGIWEETTLYEPLPPAKSPDDLLKVYFWNMGDTEVLADDFEISVRKE